MPDQEHILLLLYVIPEEIIKEYGLSKIALNSKVYIEICKVMYGLLKNKILA